MRYCDLTKRRKDIVGLLIGINYTGTTNALRGCINDIENTKEFLQKSLDVREFRIMSDDKIGRFRPTKENILYQLERLAEMSWVGYTKFFIHYSGHGTYIKDQNGDEDDSNDEALVSLDLKYITDDELNKILCKFSPISKIFFIVDACHSGTSLDLPIHYSNNVDIIEIENTTSPICQVIQITGCKDTQTSADIYNREEAEFGGALTITFHKLIDVKKSFISLTREINASLIKEGYQQRPQLSSSRLLGSEECLMSYFSD